MLDGDLALFVQPRFEGRGLLQGVFGYGPRQSHFRLLKARYSLIARGGRHGNTIEDVEAADRKHHEYSRVWVFVDGVSRD